MSDHDSSSRPGVRPFLASDDVGVPMLPVETIDQQAPAEPETAGAFLPASALVKRETGGGRREAEGDGGGEPEEKSAPEIEGVAAEVSPVKVVGAKDGDEVLESEATDVSERIEKTEVEAVGAPMAHYQRSVAEPSSKQLSAAEIALGGRRSGSTKKARITAAAGMAAVAVVAVAVYVANQEVYSLFGPAPGAVVSTATDSQDQQDQNQQPATLAAMAGKRQLTLTAEAVGALEEGHYQLWLEQDNQTTSVGVFTVTDAGQVVDKNNQPFKAEVELSEQPARFLVTIESGSEAKLKPSATVLLSGAIVGQDTTLTFAPLKVDDLKGVFSLGAPTDLSGEHPLSGIWFAKADGQKLTGAGLNLPKAPTGWIYEGQMIYKNQVIAMGRFSLPTGQDDFHRFTPNPDRIPAWPGEDYLQGAPSRLGLDFPTDLTSGDWKVLITLEPDTNGVDPTGDATFYIHLLEAKIAKGSQAYQEYELKKVEATLPSLTVTLK